MKFDYDRLTALSSSIAVIILTAGFSLLLSFVHVLSIAKSKECSTDNAITTLVVLGKRLENNLPDNEYLDRLDRAKQVLKGNLDSKVYILGGVTGVSDMAESEVGKSVLIDSNINHERIFLEKKSKHTLENLKNFYNLSSDKNQEVLLITNRYHMARSIMMAKGFKINALSCPAEDSFEYTLSNIGRVVIEAFFINFYLAGKYWAILTGNNRILDRISTVNR
ncbi:hypothetical protein [uncultured Gammaproteobacteria bacterium]|nr:hypothetical protein [uncultured Gammaproteobacteria bacterium]